VQPGALPPLVKAKLSPPQVEEACLREDALELLGQLLRKRVTLVSAPAGYGKTTVVVATIRRLGLRAVWYKLDVLDQDPVSLIASLVEALARMHDGFGERIRARLSNAHDVPYPAEQMTAEFVAEAGQVVTDDVHFVLDDYQEAADSRALNATLDYLIADLPATIRFVVLSRYEPAFGTAKLKLEDELGVFGAEHLRFGPREVREVVSQRAGESISDERATALAELTEGWPASVVLAAMAARWVGVDTLENALSDPRLKQDVFSYLAEQVYSRESPEVRAFLRRTCCLDFVSADLATQVGAPRRTHRILAHLRANGVFTFATDQDGTFRYHSLFREFLRQKTIQEDGADRYHRLQVDTAAALEARGDTEKAIDLCLAANEPDLALAVVSRAGEKNLDAFRSHTLDSWLERLPDHVRREHPWAQLVAGQVDMRAGRFDDALRHDALALESFRSASDVSGMYHALSARERTLFWQGDAAGAASACREALDVADTSEQRVHTLISLGAALESECRWAEAKAAWQEARELASDSFPGELARLAAHSAEVQHLTGRFNDASKAIRVVQASVARHGSPSLQTAFLNLTSANYVFTADWLEAQRALDAARQLGERFGYRFLTALVDDVDGQLGAAVGDWARARDAGVLAMDAPSVADDSNCRSLAICHVATAARRGGEAHRALGCYEAALREAGQEVAPYAFLNISANLAFCDSEDIGASIARLATIATQAYELDLQFLALKAEFFGAVLRHRQGACHEATEILLRCVPRQLELGHLNFLAQELVLEPDIALGLAAAVNDDQVADSLLDVIARHWNGLELLIACTDLGPIAGVAAARAAVARRSEAEAASVLAKASRSPHPEVRRTAAALRRRRQRPTGSPLGDLGLTARERQILSMIAAGDANPEIARRLVLSPATVKTHVNHIFTKLAARDRVHAALIYRNATATDPPDGGRPTA
jgi:ATP/maltotriose-dependent transcriptional regulator MalT